jgi:NADPH2:quinone reductase
MRAIRFHALGGPEVLKVDEVPDPAPKPGQVVVGVRAVGVNWADGHFRKGEYFIKPVFPQIAGMEAAGEVVAVGEGVSGVAVGAKVMALGPNAYAERMVARAEHVYPMPAGLSFEDAAALPIQGLTAMHVLKLLGRLAPGEGVLVHAAAGGVGTFAVQLAKRMGASFVAGTVGSAEKTSLVRDLGADVVIDASKEDFVSGVKGARKRGVDVVLEMVGGAEQYMRNLACLAPFGRMIVYGAASGQLRGTFEPVGLMGKNLTVSGYYLTPLLDQVALCAPPLAELAKWVVEGSVRVVRAKTYRFADVVEAHRAMERRETVGKIVLVP